MKSLGAVGDNTNSGGFELIFSGIPTKAKKRMGIVLGIPLLEFLVRLVYEEVRSCWPLCPLRPTAAAKPA